MKPLYSFFNCCLTSYHKISSLKKHPCIVSQFCRFDWVFCLGSHKAKIRVLAGLSCVCLRLCKESAPSSFTLLAGSCCGWRLRSEVLVSLLAISQGHALLPEVPTFPLTWPLPSPKPQGHIQLLSCFEVTDFPFCPRRRQHLPFKCACD